MPAAVLPRHEAFCYAYVPDIFPFTPDFWLRPPPCANMVAGKGTMPKLTNTIIEAAIAGFEAQKKSIDAQIEELRGMLTGTAQSSTEEAPAKGTRRKRSAAVRKRMREAQKLRWAKIKGESPAPAKKTPVKAAKPKRKLSAAGRKAISDAVKKRWAAKKAAAA
jgi:hypothetical protein